MFGIAFNSSPARAQSATEFENNPTTRTSHKVTGWEKGLVNRSRNLSNYYWTPQTFYTQGSRRTSKGARAVAPGSSGGPRQYVKAKFVPLPKNDRIKLSTSSSDNNQAQENCSAMLSYGRANVATYADYSLKTTGGQNLTVKAKIYRKAK